MMVLPRPVTEQPQANQSSFGPGNQQSSFNGDWMRTPTGTPTPNGPSNTGVTGFSGMGNPANTPAPMSPLPWQQNTMQQPISAPSNSVGHDGSFGGMNREQWRDAWMGSGVKDQAGTDAWLTQNGATKLAGNGTFMTPFGETLDLGQNYRSGNVTPAWTAVGSGPGLQAGQQMPQMNPGSIFGPSNGGMDQGMGLMQILQQMLNQQGIGGNPNSMSSAMMNPGEPPLAIKQQLMQQQGQIPMAANRSLFTGGNQTSQQPYSDISSFLGSQAMNPFGGLG